MPEAMETKEEKISGSIYIRTNILRNPGDFVKGHAHEDDHTTFFEGGRVGIDGTLTNGEKRHLDYKNPAHLLIHRDVLHQITNNQPTREEAFAEIANLTKEELAELVVKEMTKPIIFHCVFSHTNSNGKVVSEYEGFDQAYGQPINIDSNQAEEC